MRVVGPRARAGLRVGETWVAAVARRWFLADTKKRGRSLTGPAYRLWTPPSVTRYATTPPAMPISTELLISITPFIPHRSSSCEGEVASLSTARSIPR